MLPEPVASQPDWHSNPDSTSAVQFPLSIRPPSSVTSLGVSESATNSPLKLTQGELTESMLVPLVNQFGVMQQQMFDQFQQSMAMMVQMFGTMHRDQMAVIREELDRLNELTAEFHALKAELASRTQDPSAAPGTLPEPAGHTGPANVSKPGPYVDPTSANPSSSHSKPDGGSATTNVRTAPPASFRSDQRSLPVPPRASAAPKIPEPSPRKRADEKDRKPHVAAQAQSKPLSAPADAERDSVVWLHQRIMVLQRERETRWHKILKLLPGAS
jgi:uncharacterized small protein (DUF1192 family)